MKSKTFGSGLKIITNGIPRLLVNGYELTSKEREEFDYLKEEELDDNTFFRYRGNTYGLNEFMRINNMPDFKDWDGYSSDSFFSGIVVKYCDCEPWYDSDRIIVGLYLS